MARHALTLFIGIGIGVGLMLLLWPRPLERSDRVPLPAAGLDAGAGDP